MWSEDTLYELVCFANNLPHNLNVHLWLCGTLNKERPQIYTGRKTTTMLKVALNTPALQEI